MLNDNQVDELLRRTGQAWRDTDGKVESAPTRKPTRTHSAGVQVATIAALIVVVSSLGMWALKTASPNGAASVTANGSGQSQSAKVSASAPANVTPSMAPTASSIASITACTASQLRLSVDSAMTQMVAGQQNIVLLVTNVGSAPCHFNGQPTIWAVTRAGSDAELGFQITNDPSLIVPGSGAENPVLGPGRSAEIHLTTAGTGCQKTAPMYETLRLRLANRANLDTRFPQGVAGWACPLYQTHATLNQG